MNTMEYCSTLKKNEILCVCVCVCVCVCDYMIGTGEHFAKQNKPDR